MPSIPLEDNFHDLVAKAQRGLRLSDAELIERAEISAADLAAIKSGEALLGPLRRLARHLKLSPDALEALAKKEAYPRAPTFPRGFAMFNTAHEEMTVNNYLVWDEKTRTAAVIDTGADVADLLDLVAAKRLRVKFIFLTHAHEDHVAALPRLVQATGADVWIHEREPFAFPGLRRFADNAYFHLGVIAIKALPTWGHSPGQTTFYVQGLSWPLALCGDSLFSASVGGSPTHYADQVKNSRARLFSLPKDTVFGPGHGPLTTLAHERVFNPVFAPDRFPAPPAPRPSAEEENTSAARPGPARAVPLPKRARAGKAGRGDQTARPSKSAKPGREGQRAFKSRRNRSA